MGPVMKATGVWKIYPSGESTVQAVRGVDVSIDAGEMVAIMGASGCGKTTLLNILSGIDEPNSGDVHVNGEPLFGISDNKRTRMRAEYLGFIFQDFNLLPVLSAVENVELPLLLLGKSASEARKGALEALQSVGLSQRSEHLPSELSGGQQQRVAVARALVHNPTVILCDEPTGNLDSVTSAEVLELLHKLNRERNTTFLIVTHDAMIAKRCTRTLQMLDGTIVEDRRNEEE
ncbi:MAG: ABC transporter ATP-binding protein [Euryarchaeota archaeon]|jgi:putative ABC transport system ATP-binding protein|nr:ABC transporter ATP-binding protein [Euryarchaeota archaeon]MBT5025870.1 ABC transporter ATP-binding protein [Euryarchaeota archaeon]MBT6254939.1 ABC transporter ATP-binding protein [Euryarchaeota archaeon]MBT6527821.1 ABC transporter ATP-binding protein [Euryarchaeota archaeon]MBT7961290.1 ABC transporter ATP-binding protein [Euryarchaeota archaeon]